MNKNSKFKSRLIEKVNLIPILFSTLMVKAIINGNKTQTRRLVKPQPPSDYLPITYKGNDMRIHTEFRKDALNLFEKNFTEPFGKPGDIIWVRETWAYIGDVNEINPFVYKANVCSPEFDKPAKGWKPSIYMPFEACRLFLRVKSVRVERLNDISENDAKAEGVEDDEGYFLHYKSNHFTCIKAKDSFSTLWESINGRLSWISNPWVWVIEFERVNEQDILLPF